MRSESRTSDAVLHLATGLLVRPSTGEVFKPDGRRAITFARSDRYVRVFLRRGESCQTFYAHRLVWEAVNGKIPDGFHVDHLDGNPRNNAIGNLEMVAPQENYRRQVARNLIEHGYSTHSAKLSQEEVRAIEQTIGRIPTKVWARRLGVDAGAVRCVRKRHRECRRAEQCSDC